MIRTHATGAALATALLTGLIAQSAHAQQPDFDKVEIRSEKVADGFYVLFGQGGNIGVSVGEDGVFLIDDQFAPLTEKIMKAVAGLSKEPLRFVLNTHWHGDHTGGNENLGKAGATIVAQDNVRVRMGTEQVQKLRNRTLPASPAGALPVITFSDAITFHWNGTEIHAFHVEPAHTDGDSIVHFRALNVLHMGDTYFNGLYPFIDVDSGGSIEGMIAAADRALALTDDATRIVPGHGALSNAQELKAFRDMLEAVRAAIQKEIDAGKSIDQVVAAKPTAAFDAKWATSGFLNGDTFTRLVYADLTRSR